MNYIHQLQAELNASIAATEAFKQSLNDFRQLLHSPKFTGMQADGERKDWISTGDVLAMLWNIENNALAKYDEARALAMEFYKVKSEAA
mgnify:CR=1 FL=1